LDKVNPDVAIIRKSYPTNIERGWGYIELLLQKTNLKNSAIETWLNTKYHILEENQSIQSMDTRPIAAGLVYIAGIFNGEEVTKEMILQIMKPMTEISLSEKINELKLWLNL
jgi:L-2-hydroxyglutarate oxidase LhgO